MSRVLVVLALLCSIAAAVLGFDLISTSSDPHVLGWIGLALAFGYGADLVP